MDPEDMDFEDMAEGMKFMKDMGVKLENLDVDSVDEKDISHHESEGEYCPCLMCTGDLIELDFEDWDAQFILTQKYIDSLMT